MKIKTSHFVLTAILAVLILLTFFHSCVSFKPHYATSSMNYAAVEAFQEIADDANSKIKKEGFAEMGVDKPIDPFSGTKGSPDCDGISSGLTNSKGGLCLSNDQQQLLRTRGGNASGGDAQIGR